MQNLLTDEMWRVRTNDGVTTLVAFTDLTNPRFIAFDYGRSEWDHAALELAAGIASVIFRKQLGTIAGAAAVVDASAIAVDEIAPAFDLNRFMQEQRLESKPKRVGEITAISPPENTIEHNADVWGKRDQIDALELPDFAIALASYQQNAFGGGVGYRDGMRAKAPASLAVMAEGASLWQTIAAHAYWPADWPEPDNIMSVFPWMRPVRLSVGDTVVTPEDVHRATCLFAMPRRVMAEIDGDAVRNIRMAGRGEKYTGWSRISPFTPYSKPENEGQEPRPYPGFRLSRGYSQWPDLVLGYHPAPIVELAIERWREAGFEPEQMALHAFGLAANKASLTAVHERRWPIYVIDPDEAEAVLEAAENLIAASSRVAKALYKEIDNATRPPAPAGKGRTRVDVGRHIDAERRFWIETEPVFFAHLSQVINGTKPNPWGEQIARVAGQIAADEIDLVTPDAALERRIKAHVNLSKTLKKEAVA